MNILEYLKQCSVKSVDELTDEQVVDYYTKGNAGIAQKCAVELALQDYSECGFTKDQIMTSIYNPQNEMLAFCKTKCSIRKTKRIFLRVPSYIKL